MNAVATRPTANTRKTTEPPPSAATWESERPEDEETDDEKRVRIAFDANYSIQELAKALKAHALRESSDDWPVYSGILGQIQQLSEVVFCAMQLGGTEVNYPRLETLQHFLDGHFTLIAKAEK